VSSALLKQCPGITLKLMVFFLTAVPRERISKMMNTPGMRQRNLLVSSSRTSMGNYGPAKNGDWSSPMLIETSSTPFTSNRRNRSKAVPAPDSMGEAPFRSIGELSFSMKSRLSRPLRAVGDLRTLRGAAFGSA
jgi:hypothetical protein